MKKTLISDKGIDFIAKFDGFSSDWYECPAGYKTIGYGHVKHIGDEFKTPITKEKALELMRDDVDCAQKTIRNKVLIELNQYEYDALVSFVFSVGSSAFSASTMLKLLNLNDIEGAGEEFLRWIYVGRHVLPGLRKRRAAERELFLSGAYE